MEQTHSILMTKPARPESPEQANARIEGLLNGILRCIGGVLLKNETYETERDKSVTVFVLQFMSGPEGKKQQSRLGYNVPRKMLMGLPVDAGKDAVFPEDVRDRVVDLFRPAVENFEDGRYTWKTVSVEDIEQVLSMGS